LAKDIVALVFPDDGFNNSGKLGISHHTAFGESALALRGIVFF